jgi:hypothetical protein
MTSSVGLGETGDGTILRTGNAIGPSELLSYGFCGFSPITGNRYYEIIIIRHEGI